MRLLSSLKQTRVTPHFLSLNSACPQAVRREETGKATLGFSESLGTGKNNEKRCTYQCHTLQLLGLAWVQAERKQEPEAKAEACCWAQRQRDSSHGPGERAAWAAVGGAALQKPSGGKCLFNQEIDRKAELHSSLLGSQGGWGRV